MTQPYIQFGDGTTEYSFEWGEANDAPAWSYISLRALPPGSTHTGHGSFAVPTSPGDHPVYFDGENLVGMIPGQSMIVSSTEIEIKNYGPVEAAYWNPQAVTYGTPWGGPYDLLTAHAWYNAAVPGKTDWDGDTPPWNPGAGQYTPGAHSGFNEQPVAGGGDTWTKFRMDHYSAIPFDFARPWSFTFSGYSVIPPVSSAMDVATFGAANQFFVGWTTAGDVAANVALADYAPWHTAKFRYLRFYVDPLPVPNPALRAHYYRALMDGSGNVIPGCSVRVIDPLTGLSITPTIWSNARRSDNASKRSNPFVAENGIIDFYLPDAARVRLGITRPSGGGEYYIEGADVMLPTVGLPG